MIVPSRQGPRIEAKCIVEPAAAAAALGAARAVLHADPHCRNAAQPEYVVESVYFDTPGFDCFRRRGNDSLPKFRIRRYDGADADWFVEEKLRRGDEVWKRRQSLTPDDARRLVRHDGVPDSLRWFDLSFSTMQLEPRTLVSYRRTALVGENGARLTYDQGIVVAPAGAPDSLFVSDGDSVPIEAEILELKWTDQMPKAFDDLWVALAETRAAFSKYGHSVDALGLFPRTVDAE